MKKNGNNSNKWVNHKTNRASFSSKIPLFMSSCIISPPGTYSITKYRQRSSWNEKNNFTIQGESASARISLSAFTCAAYNQKCCSDTHHRCKRDWSLTCCFTMTSFFNKLFIAYTWPESFWKTESQRKEKERRKTAEKYTSLLVWKHVIMHDVFTALN